LQTHPFPAMDCVRLGCGQRLRYCKGKGDGSERANRLKKIFGVATEWGVINGRRKSLIDYLRRHGAIADKSMISDLGSASRWA